MRNWLCWVTVHLPECSSLHQHVIKHKHEKYMKDSLNNLDLFPYNFWDVMWTNHNGFTFPSYIQSSKNITKLPMDPVFMFQQVEAKLVSFFFSSRAFAAKSLTRLSIDLYFKTGAIKQTGFFLVKCSDRLFCHN